MDFVVKDLGLCNYNKALLNQKNTKTDLELIDLSLLRKGLRTQRKVRFSKDECETERRLIAG